MLESDQQTVPAPASWRPTLLRGDALLYAVSAIFSLLMGVFSSQQAQWHWGYLTVGPYVAAAVLALIGTRQKRVSTRRWREAIVAVTFLGVVAAPLALEIHWRQAQPETFVISGAGSDESKGQSPYHQVHCHAHHCVAVKKGVPIFESFFPYFPLMGIFGFPSAFSHQETGFSDARVAMTFFTVLMMAIALALLRAPPESKLRVAQVLVVLPTGALFLTTGGDDMPILALCLLSLVLIQRRATLRTGTALGLAAAMKLTAWPFALAVMAVARERSGQRAWGRLLVTMGVIFTVTVVPYVIRSPHAFVENVFSFPLGLAGVSSPAASPLPGHLLTLWWPPLRHVLLPTVFVVGGFFLVRYLRRSWPIDLVRALKIVAIIFAAVICAATATRLGYVIYPLNFWLWAHLIAPYVQDELAPPAQVSASS